MWKIFAIVSLLFVNLSGHCMPIPTPEVEERNEFVIRAPSGWGYRTFPGKNGLIGVLWPSNVSFNMAMTAIFVFLQTADEPIPEPLANINLFREKCPGADVKFFRPNDEQETEKNKDTKSIAETYFTGRCGRTMILFREVINQYTLIFALISKDYITRKQFADTKQIVQAYKHEIEESLIEEEEEENPPPDK